jgi:hypothetical protein
MIIHILVNGVDYAATLAGDVKTLKDLQAPQSIFRDGTAHASSRLSFADYTKRFCFKCVIK